MPDKKFFITSRMISNSSAGFQVPIRLAQTHTPSFPLYSTPTQPLSCPPLVLHNQPYSRFPLKRFSTVDIDSIGLKHQREGKRLLPWIKYLRMQWNQMQDSEYKPHSNNFHSSQHQKIRKIHKSHIYEKKGSSSNSLQIHLCWVIHWTRYWCIIYTYMGLNAAAPASTKHHLRLLFYSQFFSLEKVYKVDMNQRKW